MNITECLQTIRSLANGVDPESGKPLERSALVERDSTIDALRFAVEFLAKFGGQGAAPRTSRGRAWTSDEETRLVREFDAGRSIEALANDLHRSSSSIQSRLFRLGKLEAPAMNFED